ncbi:MAG TPA: phosphodiester glycosidase family protein [Vicinamibacterales bacterium]|nr:phosphodiester glycosidase family protein [Vicinamibacterales bacterium]
MTRTAQPSPRLLAQAAVALFAGALAIGHPHARTVVRADVSSGYQSWQRIALAPGVFHDRGTIQTTTAGRQAVYLLEINTADPALVLEASLSNDRVAGVETTSAQANRKKAEGRRPVGAINGDFWGPGQAPSGLHVQNGELVVDGQDTRPTFGVEADGDVVIGTATVTSTVTRPDGARRDIARTNQTRPANLLVLYTARFAGSTGTDNSGTEVLLRGVPLPIATSGVYSGTVAQVRARAGNTPLAGGDVVLSGHGSAAAFLDGLAEGDRLNIATTVTTGWGGVVHAVGGGHWLVRNGLAASPQDPGFADVTHPRSAIGVTADRRVIMAVVDGRQPGYSIGVTLPELAQLMISRGSVTAINLDGGGSSTMAVRTSAPDGISVANVPSDGNERAVSNSILLFSTGRRPRGFPGSGR